FSYVHNQPTRYSDPSGHLAPILVAILIGAAIGALAGGGLDLAHQTADVYWYNKKTAIDWAEVGWSTLGGAAMGALVGSGIGLAGMAGYGAAATVGFTGAGLLIGGTSTALYINDGEYVHAIIEGVATISPFASKGVR